MIESPQATTSSEESQAPPADLTTAGRGRPEQEPASSEVLRRSPLLASVLSIMPGLGQVYCGYYQIGFVNAIVVCVLLTILAWGQMGPATALLSVFMAFFWLYNIVDAGRRAVMVNEALAGRGSFELPEDFTTPGLKGSILGGAILVIVGILLLAQTLFDVSLEWLADWWPLAIILFGAYLILKARKDRHPSSPSS